MNPTRTPTANSSDAPEARADSKPAKTPNTDMQADDAGTADSGVNDSASQAQTAMKQTSKTEPERNGNR
jgi:hypothetical protein